MNRSEIKKELEFLHKLLEKNPDLKKQFEEFIQETEGPSHDDPLKFIQGIAGELKKELESLNISDPDWEDYTPRHSGYIEEWEAMMHMAEDLVTDVLDDYKTDIHNWFLKGKTDRALLGFIACYDGCLQTDLEDGYDTLGDASYFLEEEMRKMQDSVIQKLESVVFPNRQVIDFLKSFFSHFNKYHQDNEEYLRFFEPLLLELSGEKKRAAYMNELLDEKKIPRSYIPRVATELYKITGNKKKWLEESEGLVELDAKVARNLLEEYSQSSYDDFIRVAQKLWESGRFKELLAPFIFKNIDPDRSPEFYKNVLLWQTSNGRTSAKYKLLREVLAGDEKEKFIQAHKKNHVFYTKMLAQEQRYEEILQLVKRNRNSWHLNDMLTVILEPYPEESFKILEKKILTTLETERGRGVYQQVVEWLRLAKRIKNMEEHTNQLIHRLYNWKPALPALKDELRKAGMRRE